MKNIKFANLFLFISFPICLFAQQPIQANEDSVTQQSVKTRGLNPPQIKSFIIPAVLITYGFVALNNNALRKLDVSTRDEIQEDHPLFANHLDNYLRFVPGVAFYGLNLAGVKSKHSVADGTGLYVLSEAIMGVSTFTVKHAADRNRPDGSNNYSFPSGHTASAFASAEFLNQEYRDVSPWIGYAGYAVATATGAFRLYNNRHWVSDVVAGAGFGIASTKVAYLLYPHLKRMLSGAKNTNVSLVPTYQQQTIGLAFNATF